jgi:arsenate reductase
VLAGGGVSFTRLMTGGFVRVAMDSDASTTEAADAEATKGEDEQASVGATGVEDGRVTVGFVCVQNAGRSQMATAFAERERADRDLEDSVCIVTGGAAPAEHVHDVVVDVMADVGFDLVARVPREVSFEEIQACDIVITMGCAAEDVCPASWTGENRDWGLDDPDDATRGEAVTIRDDVETRVAALFDELERAA